LLCPPAGLAVTFSPKAGQRHHIALVFRPNIKQKWYSLGLVHRSGWEGRQNARRRVGFDKIFASFSFVYNLFFIAEWNSHDWKIFILIGVSMNHAHFIDWKRKSQSGLRTKNFQYK
jgi:hypothetical protein